MLIKYFIFDLYIPGETETLNKKIIQSLPNFTDFNYSSYKYRVDCKALSSFHFDNEGKFMSNCAMIVHIDSHIIQIESFRLVEYLGYWLGGRTSAANSRESARTSRIAKVSIKLHLPLIELKPIDSRF